MGLVPWPARSSRLLLLIKLGERWQCSSQAESCEDHAGRPPALLLIHKCAQGGKGTTQIDAETENRVRRGPSLITRSSFHVNSKFLPSSIWEKLCYKGEGSRIRGCLRVAQHSVSLPGLAETKANTQKQQAHVGSGSSHPGCANRPRKSI